MKKKLSILAVLVLAVAISAYSVGGTYAKYTTTANVTGTAAAAKWSIAMKANDTAISDGGSFDLATTISDTFDNNEEEDVATGKIAPGTYGSFALEVDGTGTEVSYGYTISFTVTNKPTNLKFYSDATMNTEITATGNVYTAESGTIGVNDAKVSSAPVYWKWVYETTDGDATDTNEGIAGADMTVNATITATQAD